MSASAFTAGQVVRGLLFQRRLKDELAQGAGRAAGLAALAVFVGGVVFGASAGAGWFVVKNDVPELLLSGTGFALWGLATAGVFSALGHAAQSFFQAKDLWMWDAAPTGAGARFADRFVLTASASLPTMMAIGSLALVGGALGGGLGLGGAVRAVIAVVVVAPLPLCAGIVLAHLGGAVLPAGQLRRISLLVLGLGVTGALVWFRRARVERLLTEQGANELLTAAKQTGNVGPLMAPPRQLAEFVVHGDSGAFAIATASVAACVAVAWAAHVFLYDRARKLAVDESPTGVLTGSFAERVLRTATNIVAADLRPLLQKDLLAFVRDPGQWGQVVLLLGVGVLYIVNASALSDGLKVLLPPLGAVILTGAHVGIVCFVAGGLAARFAFPQIGLEGPAIWIIDGAPLAPPRLLLGKWLASLPVVVIFPAVLAVTGAVVLDFGPWRVIWTSLLIVTVSTCVAGAAVFRGAIAPRFDAASLSELAMGPGAVSTMVLATSLAFFASVCSIAAAALFSYDTGDKGVFVGTAILAAPIAATAVAARLGFTAGIAALLRRRSDDGARSEVANGERRLDALE